MSGLDEKAVDLCKRLRDALCAELGLNRAIHQALIREANAYLTAVGPAGQVEVKPLEWNPYRAETPWGYYQIDDQRDRPADELRGRPPFLLSGSQINLSRHETLEAARGVGQSHHDALVRFALIPAPSEPVTAEPDPMSAEEHRLEDLKQMAAYAGPIVSFDVRKPYYLASCDCCGWVGSSELCGTDSGGDDSDVYCPRCHASGADCGKVAAALEGRSFPPSPVQDGLEALVERLRKRRRPLGDGNRTWVADEICTAAADAITALIAERDEARRELAETCGDGDSCKFVLREWHAAVADRAAHAEARAETAEHKRAEEWRRRRDAEGSRDTAYAACETMRMERDTALDRNAEIEEETRERCAKIAEAMPRHIDISPAHIRGLRGSDVAAAIRSSAQQEKAE